MSFSVELEDGIVIGVVQECVKAAFSKNGFGHPGVGYARINATVTDYVKAMDPVELREMIASAAKKALPSIVDRVTQEQLEKHLREVAAKMRKQGTLFQLPEGEK